VQAATVGALTLEQWIEEFKRLKKLNAEIMKGKAARKRASALLFVLGPVPGPSIRTSRLQIENSCNESPSLSARASHPAMPVSVWRPRSRP
jgi:hypothetical protein